MDLLKEAAKKMKRFLEDNRYEFGVCGWEDYSHTRGMENYVLFLVNPKILSDFGEARTLAVTPTNVIDYEIYTPFADTSFYERFRIPYFSPNGLKAVLDRLMDLDLGCWLCEIED